MNKILLTGGSGFIGSHLLERAGGLFGFRCLVRPGSSEKVKTNGSVEIIEGDLLSESSVKKAMEGVDAIVHLAALIRRSEPDEIYRVNVEGTRLLISEASKQGVSRFIFVSTENALREDLHDAYAESKRQAESLVRTFKNFLILRPCFVYGRGDDHGLGRLIELAKKSPVIPLFGGLTSEIQPLYIDDMTEYLVRALENPPPRGEYLLAGPDKISLNDFLKEACLIQEKKRLLWTVPYPLFKFSAIVCDKLPRSIGWGTSQLNNIYKSRTYSIENTVRDFGVVPRSVGEGLSQWFDADKSLKKAVSK